jgi:hypothetical protein
MDWATALCRRRRSRLRARGGHARWEMGVVCLAWGHAMDGLAPRLAWACKYRNREGWLYGTACPAWVGGVDGVGGVGSVRRWTLPSRVVDNATE